jgi:methionine synthase II (cobalamin-independent)
MLILLLALFIPDQESKYLDTVYIIQTEIEDSYWVSGVYRTHEQAVKSLFELENRNWEKIDEGHYRQPAYINPQNVLIFRNKRITSHKVKD